MRFCKLDNDGKILNITEVLDSDTQVKNASSDGSHNTAGSFDENIGIQFCKKPTGWASWVADTSERKGTAVIGGSYDQENDVFIADKPFSSWTFNYSTGKWEPPVPYPDANPAEHFGDGPKWPRYKWNESNQAWDA